MSTRPPIYGEIERLPPALLDPQVDVRRMLRFLRRRLPIILAVTVIVAVGGFLYVHSETKQYTATASLLFNQSQATQALAGISVAAAAPDPSSNVEQVELSGNATRTAAVVGHGLTAAEVRGMLSAAAVGTTDAVTVSATTASPSLAADVANTFAAVFVSEQAGQSESYYRAALSTVSKQLAAIPTSQLDTSAASALQARQQQLGLLLSVPFQGVQLARRATVPTAPSSPHVTEDTVIAVVLGLLIGSAIAFGLELLDRIVREPEEFESVYGLSLLGVIPENAALDRPLQPGAAVPAVEPEAFQLIQAHLRYFSPDRELQTLLVTSAVTGDGKSTIAVHLAAAASRIGSRVLLIEADLRRPQAAKSLGASPIWGLADVLIDTAPVAAAIQTLRLESPAGGVSVSDTTLDVLFAGTSAPPNPAGLIQSRAMETVLNYARSHYDVVILDTPPLTAVSDAFALIGQVDGVVVVGRVAHSRRDAAARAADTLRAGNAPALGVIANGVKTTKTQYYYGYDLAKAG